MALKLEPDAEPLPGYRLLKPLGRGGVGEVWVCEAPGGLLKAVKFVRREKSLLGLPQSKVQKELDALNRVKGIRHPFLLSIERIEIIDGELVIVTELADRNSDDAWNTYRQAGQAGIPRAELLGYLQETAEALDVLNIRYGLQHLDIKPANLLLVSDHIKVADFGLVASSQTSEAGQPNLDGLSPQYAAPERFSGQVSTATDQYSLALVFHQLLVGKLPFQGTNFRQWMMRHTQEDPGLNALPVADRSTVARALAKDSGKRFPCCLDFVRALAADAVHIPRPIECPGESAPAEIFSPGTTEEFPRPMHAEAGAIATLLHCPEADRGPEDTSVRCASQTDKFPTEDRREQDGYVAADHRLLKCLGQDTLGESWQAVTHDGRVRLLRLLWPQLRESVPHLDKALSDLEALSHPQLVPFDILRDKADRIILARDLVTDDVRGCYEDSRTMGLPGIPRHELLEYLIEAAAILDSLYKKYRISHLDLSPERLVFRAGQLQIADFGLLHYLGGAGKLLPSLAQGHYAAPERADHRVDRTSDQFSLAVLYQEMLTGYASFRVRARRQKRDSGLRQPDLSCLVPADRAILLRALHPDPRERFSTCSDLIEALAQASPVHTTRAEGAAADVPELEMSSRVPSPAEGVCSDADRVKAVIRELAAAASGTCQLHSQDAYHYTMRPDGKLEYRCLAWLPPGMTRLKLAGFCEEWRGQVVEQNSEESFRMRIPLLNRLRIRLFKSRPFLEIRIQLERSHGALSALTALIGPVHLSNKDAGQLLKEIGVRLLDSLNSYLHPQSERRQAERFVYQAPLLLVPIPSEPTTTTGLQCVSRDISLTGMGLLSADSPATRKALLNLKSLDQKTEVMTLVDIVRISSCSDKGYKLGIRFTNT